MIKILKNFLSKSEIDILNSWCSSNYTKSFFRDPGMDPYYAKTRLTTRGSGTFGDDVQYPKECYEIQSKLLEEFNIKIPRYPPPFYKGIVNGIGFEKGSIFEHEDPIYFKNTFTLHCNFVTQNPIGGGETIINGKKYNFEESDGLVYVVSHQKHEVTPIIGNTPRILWCYGFCINESEVFSIFGKKINLYNHNSENKLKSKSNDKNLNENGFLYT